MAGSLPAAIRNGSPIRCNEKPWDFWVSELGRSSPLRDEDTPGIKGGCRRSPKHNGITKLKHSSMSLYGEFPSTDSLTVAVCHLCDMSVKLTAVSRHLSENHSLDSILPPPPPTVKHKSSKSKHKYSKEQSLPIVDIESAPPPSSSISQSSMPQESPPIPPDITQTVTVSVPHIVLNSSQDNMSYYPDMDVKCTTQSEVKVSLEENDLPVVSIQDNTDLPLADDIIEIMNSEGIQSIEDIPEADTNAWKNLIQDFGAIQDMTLQNASILSDGSIATHDLYDTNGTPVRVAGTYTLTGDNNTIQYTQPVSLQPNITVDSQGVSNFPVKPVQCAPVKPLPTTKPKAASKGKTSKFQTKEYDPNKHCGVICVDSQKPCTRSLTCKAHTLSLRRQVDGRIKSFDALLAEHRAAKQASLSSISSGVNISNNVSNQNSSVQTTSSNTSTSSNLSSRVLINNNSQPNTLVNQNGVVNHVNLASQVNTLNTHSNILNVNEMNSMASQQQQAMIGMGSQPTMVNQLDLVTQVNLTNQMLNQPTLSSNQQTTVGLSSPLVMDMNAFSELDSDKQVTEYYNNVMSSVSDVIEEGTELLVDSAASSINIPPPRLPEPRPTDIFWYPSAPRPLASCTFSTYHMGNALVLGKRLATIRSNFKSSLMRPHTKNICNNFYNFSQNSLTSRVNKTLHVNNSNKPATPEVRKLIMSCPELMGSSTKADSSYFNSRQNGHLYTSKRPLMDDFDDMEGKCMRQTEAGSSVRNKVSKHSNQNDLVEFMSVFDPLIADEKC